MGDGRERRLPPEILGIAENLRTQIPPKGRALLDADDAALAAAVEEAARDGITEVVVRLREGES